MVQKMEIDATMRSVVNIYKSRLESGLHAPVRFRQSRDPTRAARRSRRKQLEYLPQPDTHLLDYQSHFRRPIVLFPVISDEIDDLPVILGHVRYALFSGNRARNLIVPKLGIDHESVLIEIDIVVSDFQLEHSVLAK